MSYNILNKNVQFQGATQGTIEDIVDTHSDQTIGGAKTITYLTASNLSVTNNVGIGTASPTQPLHIKGSNAYVKLETDAGGEVWTYGVSGGEDKFIIRDDTGNDTRLVIDSAGKVGIGINNPSEKLSVVGNVSGSGNIKVVGNITGSNLSITNINSSAITCTTVSGSGNISGSAFYGDGSTLSNIITELSSAGGLSYDSGKLRIDTTTLSVLGSIDGDADRIIIYDANETKLKSVKPDTIANLGSHAISTFTNAGNADNRVVTSVDGSSVIAEPNLTFDGSNLAITSGNISGSGNLQAGGNITAGGTLQITGDITGSGTLYVDSTNNRVGIGTASPDHILHAKTSDYSDAFVASEVAGGGDAEVGFITKTPNGQWIAGYAVNTSDAWTLHQSSPTSGPRITVIDGGNVGIGVIDPDAKLEVFDTGTQLKLSYNAGDFATFAVDDAAKLTVTANGGVSFADAVSIDGNTVIGNNASDTLIISPSSITIANVAAGALDNANSYLGVGSGGALVLTSSAGTTDIDGLAELDATPHATQDEYMISDNGTEKRISVTNASNGAFALVSGDATVAAGGALTIAANAVQDGMVNDDVATGLAGDGLAAASGVLKVDLNELTTGTILYSEDYVPFVDYNSGTELSKKVTVSNFIAATAGDGLVNSSGRMALDLNELSAANVAVANDSIVIIDATDNSSKKESIADLVTGIASTGLDAVGGQLSVDVSDFMANGANNYVVTATGADAMNAEANLQFDGTVLSQGGAAGAAGVHSKIVVRKTSIVDNTATDVITFTVPNANHAAAVRIFGLANFDGCGYAQSFSFEGSIARGSGSPTDKAFSSVSVQETANLGTEFTVAVGGSANTGANSATQTFTLQLTINTDDSSSSNATFMIELINFNSTGITMVAS